MEQFKVDVLEWGSKHRVVFSFTNPKNTDVIELHNITAAFRNSETGEIVEEV